jgi:hypothetical protein
MIDWKKIFDGKPRRGFTTEERKAAGAWNT